MAVATQAPSRVPLAVIGAAIWLSSEVMFFGALLGAFYTLRASATGAFPPEGAELDAVLTGAFTVVLVVSSVTAQLAVRRLHADDRIGYRRLTLVTAALGTVFVAAQASTNGRTWSSRWPTMPSVRSSIYSPASKASI